MNMKNSINYKANFDDVEEMANFDHSDDEKDHRKKKSP